MTARNEEVWNDNYGAISSFFSVFFKCRSKIFIELIEYIEHSTKFAFVAEGEYLLVTI